MCTAPLTLCLSSSLPELQMPMEARPCSCCTRRWTSLRWRSSTSLPLPWRSGRPTSTDTHAQVSHQPSSLTTLLSCWWSDESCAQISTLIFHLFTVPPPPGSKNPLITLKMAEIRTDHLGRVSGSPSSLPPYQGCRLLNACLGLLLLYALI